VLSAVPPFLSHARKSKPAERRDRSQSTLRIILSFRHNFLVFKEINNITSRPGFTKEDNSCAERLCNPGLYITLSVNRLFKKCKSMSYLRKFDLESLRRTFMQEMDLSHAINVLAHYL
jgi:hypothetical protein